MRGFLYFFIAFALLNLKTSACNCKMDFTEFNLSLLATYNQIKICVPLKSDTINNQIHYKSVVKKNYWGDCADTIDIITSVQYDQCRYPLELKNTYLLYGNGNKKSFFISSCGFCRNLTIDSIDGYAVTDMLDYGFVFRGSYVKGLTVEGQLKKLKTLHAKEIEYLEKISKIDTETFTVFNLNKSLNSIAAFRNGKLNGNCKFYFADKTLHSTGKFVDNIKTGEWAEYDYQYMNGVKYQIKRAGCYENGRKVGVWKNEIMNKNKKEFIKNHPEFQETTNYSN